MPADVAELKVSGDEERRRRLRISEHIVVFSASHPRFPHVLGVMTRLSERCSQRFGRRLVDYKAAQA